MRGDLRSHRANAIVTALIYGLGAAVLFAIPLATNESDTWSYALAWFCAAVHAGGSIVHGYVAHQAHRMLALFDAGDPAILSGDHWQRIEDWAIGLGSAAHARATARALAKEHADLVLLKFSGGLTDEEAAALADVRGRLEVLDEAIERSER